MPIFDYLCESCLTRQEINVTIEDRDKQVCQCGEVLKRQISFVGSVFSETANGGLKR
jgi:putative FmdB family regulatory protein